MSISLKPYYHLKRNPGTDSLQGFSHSGFGNGVEIGLRLVESNLVGNAANIPPPAFTIEWQPETKKSSETPKHSIESRVSRDKLCQEKKSASCQTKRDIDWAEKYHESIKNGIFLYKEVNPVDKS